MSRVEIAPCCMSRPSLSVWSWSDLGTPPPGSQSPRRRIVRSENGYVCTEYSVVNGLWIDRQALGRSSRLARPADPLARRQSRDQQYVSTARAVGLMYTTFSGLKRAPTDGGTILSRKSLKVHDIPCRAESQCAFSGIPTALSLEGEHANLGQLTWSWHELEGAFITLNA